MTCCERVRKLEEAKTILRLWDNPQDLGQEVYAPAHERLREAIAKAEGQSE